MEMFSFIDLPGEIRNKIYNYLLIVPSFSTALFLGDPPLYPEIISTCRQIYQEARQILYGSNIFLAHRNLLSGLPRLRMYYATISDKQLICLIRRFHIQIRLDCDPNFRAEYATEAFSGVEELTIEVSQAQFGSSDNNVLKLFEGVRGVRKTRIYGSVQAFPEYVQWLQGAMETPKGIEFEAFDKERMEKMLADRVRSYDIWTVSGNAT